MRKRKLGQTDLMLSPIGLGTVKFGRNQGVKYPEHFTLPTDQEIFTLLDKAQNLGLNVLDTAPAYGNAQTRLGKLLTNRQEWIIISKTGEIFSQNQSYFDFSEKFTRKQIEDSLKNLKTDYLDIVLVHSNGNDLDILQNTDIFRVLADLKSAGLIRAYGMSSKTLKGGLAALKYSDVGMITYHPNYTEEQPILEEALKNDKGILIKKGLASGHLNTFTGPDPIDTTLRFIFKHKAITSLIVGTINPTHLTENIARFEKLA